MTEPTTKTISLRIDEALLHAVDVAGEPEQKGRSEVIREALELWLARRQQTQDQAEARDLRILNRCATRLNEEAADVLAYQIRL
ncbi:MAG: ribbon-helix-helix protein, CopG family [Candidatus Binatia bacterium]